MDGQFWHSWPQKVSSRWLWYTLKFFCRATDYVTLMFAIWINIAELYSLESLTTAWLCVLTSPVVCNNSCENHFCTENFKPQMHVALVTLKAASQRKANLVSQSFKTKTKKSHSWNTSGISPINNHFPPVPVATRQGRSFCNDLYRSKYPHSFYSWHHMLGFWLVVCFSIGVQRLLFLLVLSSGN